MGKTDAEGTPTGQELSAELILAYLASGRRRRTRGRQISVRPHPIPAAKELWERVIDDLSGQIDGSSLHVWFERTVPTALERENLTLAVPNFFAKEYIETRFGELIESALKERLSKKASLLVIVGGSVNL